MDYTSLSSDYCSIQGSISGRDGGMGTDQVFPVQAKVCKLAAPEPACIVNP